MEMEGRGFSDLLRNTSEEIFLKTMMENPIGITAPSMEMLGFKNITQSFRGDSEELFNSWLTNGEIPGNNSSVVSHRTRQSSRRIPADLASSQQQKKSSDDHTLAPNSSANDENANDHGQCPLRNAAEKGMQASNLYLAKAWFNSTQPMTRSRSSELRRRYAAMQCSQMTTIPQAPHNAPIPDINKMKQEFPNTNNFYDVTMNEVSNQMHSFMSPSNSSTSFNAPPVATVDTVSSVVNMLKGTLERKKKLNNKEEKEMTEGSPYGIFSSQEAAPNICSSQAPSNQNNGASNSFHMTPLVQVKGPGSMARVGKSLELSMDHFPAHAKQTHLGAPSQELSQSESSTAAPALSTGFEVCDGPSHSGYAISNGVSSSGRVTNGAVDHDLKTNDYKERIFENGFKDAPKNTNLVRMGSFTSTASVDKSDPTKKRRVERSRKMAEAKERNSTPPLPSDMQAILKRCETLEKEVRSLKLNLSFMNRKDSEQTKQIEELQKQNDELAVEKERLLEEIERIIDPGRM
ncbi:hypothetical protein HPP92_002168 [Vanilla planifolia]|uniref:Protein CYCLOPS n=1 Tax=Vanilla planifolia TaxID=51239 RepID=A0A835S973_VANPL|nr:hypothetical protein HPP92_002168 [Vanilla planifolia]